jgi:hypothetical protein
MGKSWWEWMYPLVSMIQLPSLATKSGVYLIGSTTLSVLSINPFDFGVIFQYVAGYLNLGMSSYSRFS